MNKKCIGKGSCGELKSLKEFRLDNRVKSGYYNICIECDCKRSIQNYYNNQEELKKQSLEYYYKNKKQCNKRSINYNNRNREKINKYIKRYRQNHKERLNKQTLVYYYNNKEKIDNSAKEYKSNHKEETRQYNIKNGIITGTGQSIPEQKIETLLKKKGLRYEKEKTFEDCRNKQGNLLFFDFYVPYFDIIIEFDGIHHFQPIFNNLEQIQEHDKIKTKYCKGNNIYLLRISYKNFDNIINILKKELCF